jgi:hypothetical protein
LGFESAVTFFWRSKRKLLAAGQPRPAERRREHSTKNTSDIKKVLNIFQISNNVQNKKQQLIFTKTPARLAFTFDECKPD